MDARVDRRTLLRKLIDDRFHGSVAEFARAIGRSPSQVHQWLHGHRRLGDAGARHIEKTLPGLWQGYFDGEPPPAERDLGQSAPASLEENSIGARIREARERAGLTQPELAERCGWKSQSRISMYERGERQPSLSDLRKIADALGVTVEYLATGHGVPYPGIGRQASEESDQVLVPIYDVSAAAGAGAFVEGEQVADHLLVRADWLRELVGYLPSSDKVAIIQVRGDSMEPTLSPGDLILVERRTYTREELTDGIYVVRLEGALLVKRLQFVPGGIALISDNERYRDQVVSDVDVIARVIYAWRGKRL